MSIGHGAKNSGVEAMSIYGSTNYHICTMIEVCLEFHCLYTYSARILYVVAALNSEVTRLVTRRSHKFGHKRTPAQKYL